MQYTTHELLAMAENGKIYVPVESSIIEAISYDLIACAVIVSITGSRDDYIYEDKTFVQFEDFVNADSKGWFYNTYVRGRW
jgi:hypothetical protein